VTIHMADRRLLEGPTARDYRRSREVRAWTHGARDIESNADSAETIANVKSHSMRKVSTEK
jgi:hypothetical protein